MSSWREIHDFFEEGENDLRWEYFRLHSKFMLEIIPGLSNSSKLEDVQPGLVMGSLNLRFPGEKKEVRVFLEEADSCRITLYDNLSDQILTTEFVKPYDVISKIENMALRIKQNE